MAIKSNDSTEQVAGFKKFTGIAPVKVLAVNPTKSELEALGFKAEKEPEYTKTENGIVNTRLDFIIEQQDVKIKEKLTFFLTSEKVVAKTGKIEVINNIGQHAYVESLENITYTWFARGGVRQTYKGEANLMDFIINWANVKPGDEVSLDNIQKIIKGDVGELKKLVKDISNNLVKVLFLIRIVDDKQYQGVYAYYTQRETFKRDDLWAKHLSEKNLDASKYYYTLPFTEFAGLSTKVTMPDNDDALFGNNTKSVDELEF